MKHKFVIAYDEMERSCNITLDGEDLIYTDYDTHGSCAMEDIENLVKAIATRINAELVELYEN